MSLGNRRQIAVATVIAACSALLAASPASAQSSRQKDKNNMRNLGVGLGAAAVYEAVNRRTTNAVVLGAGAAYAAKKYEDARKAQNRENGSWRGSSYWRENGYRTVSNRRPRRDNGLHKGWYKNKNRRDRDDD